MNEPNNGATKRLYRIRDGRVVAGVCAGLAAYFGVDPTLVRLAFALLTVFGGVGILLYLGAWLVMPDEVDGTSIAESVVNKRRSLASRFSGGHFREQERRRRHERHPRYRHRPVRPSDPEHIAGDHDAAARE
jgi:phage shock protein PspC (stress-responsive transcriptional regulator)